jgi:hypothetical protein
MVRVDLWIMEYQLRWQISGFKAAQRYYFLIDYLVDLPHRSPYVVNENFTVRSNLQRHNEETHQ